MPNYNNGKIYKIVDNTNGNVYIGSTCMPLYQRLGGHVSGFKNYVKGKNFRYNSIDIIMNDNYEIILLELYPCKTRSQLMTREGFYQRTTYNCINKIIYPPEFKKYVHKEFIYKNPNMSGYYICDCGKRCKIELNKMAHMKSSYHQYYLKKTLNILH